jgi:hypothetical protein
MDDSQHLHTLTSPSIMPFARLPDSVTSVQHVEQQFRKLCLQRAAPQQQQPDKGEGRVVLRTPGGVGGGQRYCYGTGVFR